MRVGKQRKEEHEWVELMNRRLSYEVRVLSYRLEVVGPVIIDEEGARLKRKRSLSKEVHSRADFGLLQHISCFTG